MSLPGRWIKRLRFLLCRRDFEADLKEEMAFHQEQLEESLKHEGKTAEEAHYAATQRFGNELLMRERSHEAVAFRAETVVQDLRFAARQMARDLGVALMAILMLALGVAASVAIFAFVDSALIQPLPFAQPNSLMDVTESLPMFPRGNLSYPDYIDWKRLNTVFTSIEVYRGDNFLLQAPNGAEPVPGMRVSSGFFNLLGITPAEGRDFRPGEDDVSAPSTVLLSYGAWQRRFGGKRDIVGQTIQLSGVPTTIIGVLPASFQFALLGNVEFFTTFQPKGSCDLGRSCHGLNGVGRLKDGVTGAAALANMKAIALQLERQYPDSNRGQGASVMPLAKAITGEVRPILLVLLGGAGLLLLIACVNVSSLLLVRAEKRRREMAVRGALGASRARLIRQYLTEILVLVGVGMVLGIALAAVTMRAMRGMISKDLLANMPYLQQMGLTLHVWIFALALAVLATGLFSLAPILRLPMGALRDGLSDGGRAGTGSLWRRLGANLVIVELAVAVVLLSGAGLLAKSFWKMLHVELGFEPQQLATLQVGLPNTVFKTDALLAEFVNKAIDRVRSLPGVQSAAVITILPVTCNCDTDWVRFAGRPYNGVHNVVNDRRVSADYFHTMQAQLVRGRFLTENDDASHPKVVVINDAFARKYFPGEDPIGSKIGDTDLKPDSLRQIVGVVADMKDGALDSEEWPTEYESFAQDTRTFFSLVVRTSQNEESILPELVATIRHLSPDVGVQDETTMPLLIRNSPSAWLHRTAAWLVGGFAVLAFLLSIIGLYGTISYSISQRTREIGIRMALGAQRSFVHRMILREAGWLTIIGLAIGLAGSVAAASFMGSLLFGVRAWDLITLMGVTVVLAIAALLASSFPARRAAAVNPVEALRAE
jgi:macrolide transport system ATP-binding/permease protein